MQLVLVERGLRTRFLLRAPSQPVRRPGSTFQFTSFVSGRCVQLHDPVSGEGVFSHFMAVAYPELRRQAANVVKATPGRVIAYAGNPATKAAIEADGIAVDPFAARELWAWHGGPHCLTQPLARS